jgi:DNA polymerase-3 subunit delta'
LLQQALARKRIAPAYLFAGPAGTGRALAARYFSQQLLCLGLSSERHQSAQQRLADGNHPDFLRVEPTYQHQGQTISAAEAAASGLKRKAPPQIRIEQVREITQFLSRPPLEAHRAVAIIEEAQSMAEAAANALLKTLEEPGRATIILIAPSRDSLLPTLVSRCQQISFYRLSEADMAAVLRRCGGEAVLDYPELLEIAQGSPGQAIASLAQLQAMPEALRQRLAQLPKSRLDALDIAKTIAKELDTQAQLWLIDYLQSLYWRRWQQKHMLDLLEKARQYLLGYVQPRLVWECTLLAFVAH